MRAPEKVIPPIASPVIRWLCLLCGVGFIALWAVIAYLRLVYPYEVEWMEGAMLDHACRILDGKPLYTAPSIDFVAWLYPPLYYYALAGVMKIVGVGFLAGRLLSIASTLLTATLLAAIAKQIPRDSMLAFLTAALYIATYHATGFYFDIARNDAFFTMLLVATAFAAVTIGRRSSRVGYICTGILLAVAIATKQQAVFFLPAIGVWFWFRDRLRSVVFALTAIVLAGGAFIVTNAVTHGWLAYYLLRIPQAKRADFVWLRMLDVFPRYVFGIFTASTLALIALIGAANTVQRKFWSSSVGLLTLMTIAALVAGAISLGNEGGYANVMMPFAAFLTPFLPIAAHRFGSTSSALSFRRVSLPALLILFQFGALSFNPLSEKMLLASAHQRQGGDEFFRALRAIPGDVYIPYHGFIAREVGKPTHAHLLASLDVLRVHDTTAKRLQADLDSAFARHAFSAVILEESSFFGRDSVTHYTFSRRMIAEPNVYLTRVADGSTRPEYLFVPK